MCLKNKRTNGQFERIWRYFILVYELKDYKKVKGMVKDMTIQQEVYEKIMKLPEDGIRLILVMANEIARQQGILFETDTDKSLIRKKKAFQNMLKMREQSTYPKDFDYKKVMEEAINEKYNFID